MAGTTRTIKWAGSGSKQLNETGKVVRIYDVFVSSSGTNPVWIAFNEGDAVDTAQKLYLKTDETGTGYGVYSSTNFYSACEGISFSDTSGCYIQTSSGFGYASITYGLDVS